MEMKLEVVVVQVSDVDRAKKVLPMDVVTLTELYMQRAG